MLSNIEWALFVYEEFLLEIEINLGLEEDKHVPHLATAKALWSFFVFNFFSVFTKTSFGTQMPCDERRYPVVGRPTAAYVGEPFSTFCDLLFNCR